MPAQNAVHCTNRDQGRRRRCCHSCRHVLFCKIKVRPRSYQFYLWRRLWRYLTVALIQNDFDCRAHIETDENLWLKFIQLWPCPIDIPTGEEKETILFAFRRNLWLFTSNNNLFVTSIYQFIFTNLQIFFFSMKFGVMIILMMLWNAFWCPSRFREGWMISIQKNTNEKSWIGELGNW